MEAKRVLQRRVGLAWLLLGLILVPATGGVLWLVVIKPPPGKAVLIEEAPSQGIVKDGVLHTPETQMGTPAQPIRFSAPTQGTREGVEPLMTSVPTLGVHAGDKTPTLELITVYVSGAVSKPGAYTLPAQSRVADAVALAGVAREEAEMEVINLAARITDEEHFAIPEKGAIAIAGAKTPTRTPPGPTRVPTSLATAPTQNAPQNQVNINTASASELETLPGIGPTLAGRIIEYRL